MSGRKIRHTIHRALDHPEISLSRNRWVMMLKRTIRYATNAKLMMMNQMMSQKLMTASLRWCADQGSSAAAEEPRRAVECHGEPRTGAWRQALSAPLVGVA